MPRPKKDATIDYATSHTLTVGLIERATCPPDSTFVLLRDADKKGLRLRVTKAGGKHWQFETRIKGKLFTRALGEWPSVSIKDAQEEAHRLRGLTEKGLDPRELEETERRQKAAEEARIAAEKKALADAAKHTLRALLLDYLDHQESLGRKSHRDARSIFKLHVFEAWPEIADLAANQVTGEQIADMMRRVVEKGKERTANKLRSYLGAAYSVAKAARSKATIPIAFKAYNIRLNPVDETIPDSSANRPNRAPLPLQELRTYWTFIQTIPGIRGAALQLHLLTGGQRIEQLVNLLATDVQDEFITLYDGKGRPGHPPRPHVIPLIPKAVEALKILNPSSTYAISTDGGDSHVHATTLSSWAKAAALEAGIDGFGAKRIRSGVETALAAAGVSSDIRGRLQSHGISGVQARHYDGHDYMTEKRQALELLFKQLSAVDGIATKVSVAMNKEDQAPETNLNLVTIQDTISRD